VRYSLGSRLTVLCGHYKDVDQRVAEGLAAEELSVGDFVLSGGEPAALCVMDAVVRLLPGALGDHESASGDSHYDGLLSPPSYTRPLEDRGVAAGGGGAADAGAAARSVGAVRGELRGRQVAPREAKDRVGVDSPGS